MIKVENFGVWGFEHAIRGMRNPMNSHDKSDSGMGCYRATSNKEFVLCKNCPFDDRRNCDPFFKTFQIGEKDLDLMKRLYKAGTEHRKYLRQIFVSMDITAPLYWWKETDQYRIGVTTNSCSTMHTIHKKPFEMDDFSYEHLESIGYNTMLKVIHALNVYRALYLNTKNKEDWYTMIQLLPSSYNQRRTITMNYENVVTIIKQRRGHKLDEWNEFVKELEQLPYVKEIMDETC